MKYKHKENNINKNMSKKYKIIHKKQNNKNRLNQQYINNNTENNCK